MSAPWKTLIRPEGTWLLHEAADWSRFAGADWLDTIMTLEVRDRYHAKQGRSIGRWTLQSGPESLVVYLKRHFELPEADARRAARLPGSAHSPGLQEWEQLQQAESFGIRVPRTVAVGELRRTDGRLQSFIALEELAGMLALHEAIPLAQRQLTVTDFATWKSGLFHEISRLSWQLHQHGYFHQDLYLCHFYILASDCSVIPADWQNRVAMIDFHRLISCRFGSIIKRWKDLSQLMFSTYDVPGLGDPDREQLWHAYQQYAQDGGLVRPWLRQATMYKAKRYYQHNSKASP